MSAELLAAMAARMERDTTPGFSAPTTCPSYPGGTVALLAPDAALTAQSLSLPLPLARAIEPAAGQAAALEDSIRLHAGRGPPPDLLS
jgi:hypothetical protein